MRYVYMCVILKKSVFMDGTADSNVLYQENHFVSVQEYMVNLKLRYAFEMRILT